MSQQDLFGRPPLDPAINVESPAIRGTGITVAEILHALALGKTAGEVLQEYPGLDEADIRACVAYAAQAAGDVEALSASAHGGRIHTLSPVRGRLIADTLEFVHRLIGTDEEDTSLTGVIRITLIGSLATDKQEPRDIDLLLTVADDMELAPLASRTRRLKERTQSYGCNADIFLANPGGEYIGRVCGWRDCRPGGRVQCQAVHCGRRPFLFDDLHIVRLPRSIVTSPPVDLWPRLITRVQIPADLEDGLINPLRGSAQWG